MSAPERREGWKIILTRRSRDEVIRKHGLTQDYIGVKTLKVIGISRSNGSIRAEVSEW